MDNTLDHCVKILKNNTASTYLSAVQTLYEICDNIIKFPMNEEYKKLRVADPMIYYRLLPASGAIELLLELGFIKDSEFIQLPKNFSLDKIQKGYKILNNLNKLKFSEVNYLPLEVYPTSKESQQIKFFITIMNTFLCVLDYESTELHQCVKKILPISKLQLNAIKKLRLFQKKLKSESNTDRKSYITEYNMSVDYLLLIEVIYWFKNEFFTWMDSPKCRFCYRACTYKRIEFRNDPKVSRVEIHQCEYCGTEEEFLRYKDLKTLLRTRTGRCGEWANVFTLICRTLEYDARIVYDQTDHVWTEVWLISLNRWIHVDPCEAILDRPLLYEKGWHKKLSYIIAFSKDEIQDVTWRYTKDQSAVLKRRNICSEEHLLSLIMRLSEERLELLSKLGLSKTRKNFIIKRRLFELVELIPAPPGAFKPSEQNDVDDYSGRISGDINWRIARNEASELYHYVWKVPQGVNEFQLQYFVVEDIYYAINSNNEVLETKEGWKAGISSYSGDIFRKVESDWKMVYLARSPGYKTGTVTWSIEIDDPEIDIDLFEFSADTATFDNGIMKWTIQCSSQDNTITTLDIPNNTYFKTNQLKKMRKINLTAKLAGDDRDISWQHSQLFRKSIDAIKKCSMKICLTLSNKPT